NVNNSDRNNKSIIDYNNNQNTILFFKIWRNSVLREEILSSLRLYNIHYNKKFNFKNMKDLSRYRFKNFISSLSILDHNTTLEIENNGTTEIEENEDDEYDEYEIFEDDDTYFNNHNTGEINKLFKYSLPSNLEKLLIESITTRICKHYKIERMLPSSLTHIEFNNFNRVIPVGAFPKGLKTIVFGPLYNQPILPGLLPPSLTLISFGYSFQQNIQNNTIPKSVTHMYFNLNYSGIIYQVLDHCTTLEYKVMKARDLLDIPKYCQTLEFINFNEHIHPNVIPPSVTKINFGNRFNLPLGLNSLPPNLRSLSFNKNYSQRIPFLSSTLTELTMGDYPPISWPLSITKLKFGQFYNSTMHLLPRSLTHLDISEFSIIYDNYNVSFQPYSLPKNLTSLTLGDYYTQVIPKNALPDTLLSLTLGSNFNHSFNPQFLPDSLTFLSLGSSFNQDLSYENSLPKNLKILVLQGKASPILKYSTLPKNLQQI
ncbi:hypothetical protein DICPUDRAFT_17674, partial [Dictyostelium purpureum]